MISDHQIIDLVGPACRTGSANIWIANRIDRGQATVDIPTLDNIKPVINSGCIRRIDCITTSTYAISSTAAHTTRIAIAQTDTRSAIIGLGPPDAESKSIINIGIA